MNPNVTNYNLDSETNLFLAYHNHENAKYLKHEIIAFVLLSFHAFVINCFRANSVSIKH